MASPSLQRRVTAGLCPVWGRAEAAAPEELKSLLGGAGLLDPILLANLLPTEDRWLAADKLVSLRGGGLRTRSTGTSSRG